MLNIAGIVVAAAATTTSVYNKDSTDISNDEDISNSSSSRSVIRADHNDKDKDKDKDNDNDNDNNKVQVELYYESQCPDCRNIIFGSFYEAYQADNILDMVDITFIPYGNAKEVSSQPNPGSGFYEFQCQHGESECVYNIIETCAINKIKDDLKKFKYINCIEHNNDSREVHQDYYQIALDCALDVDLDLDLDIEIIEEIQFCSISKEGNELEHKMALKTNNLDPKHEFVPHIVVNGIHNDEIQNDIIDSLLNFVCKTYKGINKSSSCPSTTTTTTTSTYSSSILEKKDHSSLDDEDEVADTKKKSLNNDDATTTTTTATTIAAIASYTGSLYQQA